MIYLRELLSGAWLWPLLTPAPATERPVINFNDPTLSSFKRAPRIQHGQIAGQCVFASSPFTFCSLREAPAPAFWPAFGKGTEATQRALQLPPRQGWAASAPSAGISPLRRGQREKTLRRARHAPAAHTEISGTCCALWQSSPVKLIPAGGQGDALPGSLKTGIRG